jgi:hypothetical protein
MPGGTAVPGMQRPGAGSAGAGAGKIKLVLAPSITIKGVFDLRPKRLLVPKDASKAPSLVFEVYDERELEKAKRGEKSANGSEVLITLWNDGRTYNLLRSMGYPDDTWAPQPGGGFDIGPAIDRALQEKPLLTCDVDFKEGSTPGRGFNNIVSCAVKKARTT